MREFLTKNHALGLKVVFKFDLNGVLRVLEFEGEWSSVQVKKIMQRIPADLETILADMQNQTLEKGSWVFQEITVVSFEEFYKKYPKKIGRKEETQRAWDKLKGTDPLEAILYIPELIKLKNDGTAFPYPATYLNKKLWR
ncbi:hypothetical protein [Chryseobacterium sp.]|uniref:hypothetical protein n=1 Tax=Chryseobacterium sp. TaxID=1871047 RepID=UPI002FCADF90